MITQNSAEHDCTNGDIGTLRLPDKSSEVEFYIELADGRRPQWGRNETPIELIHAYALTVHKSQGSEYPIVILPAYSCAPMLLTRNMLYTALTRARTYVILVGDADIVRRMVENDTETTRYSGLTARIREAASDNR